MKLKNVLMILLGVLAAMTFNALIGAGVALLCGYTWWYGSVLLNIIVFACGPLMRRGRANAGVHREVWTSVILKRLREAEENIGWLAAIPDYSEHVEAAVIHFVELGGDPDVLVNKNTYPLDVQTIEDADRPISLDLYETKATAISDKELDTISYDKLGTVMERHKDNTFASYVRKVLHAIAPSTHKDVESPVLLTTGELTGETNNRRRMTTADLLRLKKWFDDSKIPANERILVLCSVLCSDHVQDLLLTNESFAKQYNLDNVNGRIGRLYGFDIYEYTECPHHVVSTKTEAAYGAVIGSTHRQASVAFHSKSMMRAKGELKQYISHAKSDPIHHRNLYNLALRAIGLRLRSKGCTAAIVSAVS